ncbi:hypothetical protein [Priestia aryabhattai]
MLNEQQKQELKELFVAADSIRLNEHNLASYLHGVMLGIREALENKKMKLEGITGHWYYEVNEKGKPKRQLSASQLLREEGPKKEVQRVVEGNATGVRWTLEILEKDNFKSKDRLALMKKYDLHREELINILFPTDK